MKGLEVFTKRQKMGRLATADEIAALVIYLASEEVSYSCDSSWSVLFHVFFLIVCFCYWDSVQD